ncbi:phosphatase [Roseibium denhamense]|uniref:Histidinol-phosphatase, inositol monophosphatase family n=1 Tax=Roseibium denhamense TaxID=76305 RepID=A0ABY1PGS5_9HYPH|nr:inositol monophosphatase family protein [Roseibium denhamense]MTI04702.1 phosphatase [Roseibium denhamense]SMP33736.1 histidinol-phosphatase, inositol monophosphatase family [Roseibium denhamense]
MIERLTKFAQTANLLADAAGEIVRAAWFGQGAVSYKEDRSALTEADTNVERQLRKLIAEHHPDHGILGEEFGEQSIGNEYVWVLDPIDGTRQFGARLLNFGVLIALCYKGTPVLGVIDHPLGHFRYCGIIGLGTTLNGKPLTSRRNLSLDHAVLALANPNSFSGESRRGFDALNGRGVMTGFDGGCLAYGALARGMVDVCLNGPDLEPFDICALVPVVAGAGGCITDWSGAPLSLSSRGAIVASGCPDLHEDVLARLKIQV